MANRSKKIINNKEDLLLDNSEDFLLKHLPFIEEYMDCLNGTQAWQFAHPDAGYDVASQSASRPVEKRQDKKGNRTEVRRKINE